MAVPRGSVGASGLGLATASLLAREAQFLLAHPFEATRRRSLRWTEVYKTPLSEQKQRRSTNLTECGQKGRTKKRTVLPVKVLIPPLRDPSVQSSFDFSRKRTCTTTLGGPRLIAWSQPSSPWQHRQRPRRTPILLFVLHLPPRWGQPFCPRGDAPSTRRRRGGFIARKYTINKDATRSRRRRIGDAHCRRPLVLPPYQKNHRRERPCRLAETSVNLQASRHRTDNHAIAATPQRTRGHK